MPAAIGATKVSPCQYRSHGRNLSVRKSAIELISIKIVRQASFRIFWDACNAH